MQLPLYEDNRTAMIRNMPYSRMLLDSDPLYNALSETCGGKFNK